MGVGVEQVRQYVLLFEWSSIKEPRIADCFRSYLHLVRRIFFGFCNLDELLILSKFERIDEPIFALRYQETHIETSQLICSANQLTGFNMGFLMISGGILVNQFAQICLILQAKFGNDL